MQWRVDGDRRAHRNGTAGHGVLSHPMHTSLIFRTNSADAMRASRAEYAYYRFTPYDDAVLARRGSAEAAQAQHERERAAGGLGEGRARASASWGR